METTQVRPKGKSVSLNRIKVRFVIRKSRLNKSHECPIDCRIRVNGVAATPFSTHLMVDPVYWDCKLQSVVNDEEITGKLRSMKEGLEAVYTEFRSRGKRPQPTDVIAHFFNHELEYDKRWSMDDLIDFQKSELKLKKVHKATLMKYLLVYNRFKDFSQVVLVEHVRKSHIKSFYKYLKSLGYVNDYCNKQVQCLNGLFKAAVANDIIQNNPAGGMRFDWENKVNLTCLTEDELNQLKEREWSDKLQQVVDSFLFMCYTGLHITDYIHLTDANVKSSMKVKWIEYDRQKTGQPAIIPLHPVASSIIRKYGSISLLPRISGQKQNEYLKVIAELIGTDKHLTNKVARKTFTDMSINNRGMSFESVAAMLGHTSTKFVRVYGKVKHHRVLSEWRA